jgi:membrane protein implicated in regulation of membrane protease activity
MANNKGRISFFLKILVPSALCILLIVIELGIYELMFLTIAIISLIIIYLRYRERSSKDKENSREDKNSKTNRDF